MNLKTVDRRTFIGGSDIAAVLGLSRWKTPLQLWAEKVGEIEPKDLSNVEAVEWGTKLEELVAKKFEEVTGLGVRRAPKTYKHGFYDFFRSQVDRLVTGTDELLECKTCSAWLAKEWEGEEIPMEYILQVMWQLGITGRKVGYIAVLIGGQKFVHKRIEFDQVMYDDMVMKAIGFWHDHVLAKSPPMAVGDDNPIMFDLFQTHSSLILDTSDELSVKVKFRQELSMHIKEMEKQKDEVEAQLKQVIGDNLGVKTGEFVVTWKEQKRSGIDLDKMKQDHLYEKYLMTKKSRVLRIRNKKESENVKPE